MTGVLRAGAVAARWMIRGLLNPPCAGCGGPLDSADMPVCSGCRGVLRLPTDWVCEVCGVPLLPSERTPEGYCRRCDKRLPEYSRLRAATTFGRVSRSLVHRLKYERRIDLAPFMADFLTAAFYRHFAEEGIEMVVPVPLHPWRQWRRSFNQAELLGRELASRLHLPCGSDCLVRVRRTPRQVNLNPKKRFENVRGAFAPRFHDRIRYKNILLVDDVATTGATFSAAADALVQAGARQVHALAFARATL